jgi:hypothetical protein
MKAVLWADGFRSRLSEETGFALFMSNVAAAVYWRLP